MTAEERAAHDFVRWLQASRSKPVEAAPTPPPAPPARPPQGARDGPVLPDDGNELLRRLHDRGRHERGWVSETSEIGRWVPG